MINDNNDNNPYIKSNDNKNTSTSTNLCGNKTIIIEIIKILIITIMI